MCIDLHIHIENRLNVVVAKWIAYLSHEEQGSSKRVTAPYNTFYTRKIFLGHKDTKDTKDTKYYFAYFIGKTQKCFVSFSYI